MKRLLLVGLDEPEYLALKARLSAPIVFHPVLPKLKLEHGDLFVERTTVANSYLPVSHVVFHGIFENDFDFINTLALWRGRCLPAARGLLDGRLRMPCLARALEVTRFASMPRGFGTAGIRIEVATPSVAKWGNWHCGENKERFEGHWDCVEPTVVEPFIIGDAVRIMIVGAAAWQIRLTGDGWLKSIHHPAAAMMPIDPMLLDDARALGAHFGLELLGVDYMIGTDGTPHLLEVNHIPNVTVFEPVQHAFLDLVERWFNAGTNS